MVKLRGSKSFLKRFLFGTSKAYVQQLEKGKYYDKLCPVYGVALVNTEFENTTEDWFHHYRLTNAKDLDKTLEGLEAYDEYLDAIRVAGTVRADSFEEGREEGEQGKGKAKAIASKALAKGMSVEEVADLTGLSIDELKTL